MIAGAFARADAKRSLIRLAPTPTYISSNSLPLIKKKGTPASPATARASVVFPVPGGPVSRTPFGSLPPRLVNFAGSLRNITTSSRSSFASSTPLTSLNLTGGPVGVDLTSPWAGIDFKTPVVSSIIETRKNTKNAVSPKDITNLIHLSSVEDGPGRRQFCTIRKLQTFIHNNMDRISFHASERLSRRFLRAWVPRKIETRLSYWKRGW